MTCYTVEFYVGKKKTSFSIITNLENVSQFTVSAAVDSWAARTNDFTAISLCEYIKSKDSQFTAYPIKKVNPKQ